MSRIAENLRSCTRVGDRKFNDGSIVAGFDDRKQIFVENL